MIAALKNLLKFIKKEMDSINLYSLKTKLIEQGDDLAEIILQTLQHQSLELQNKDVIVLAETPTAIAQGRFVNLDEVTPSDEALDLAEKYKLEPKMAEVIIQQSDKIYGGVPHALLCEKDGFLTENAGVDQSNAPEGYVILSPTYDYINKIRISLEKQTGKKIGLVMTDSRTMPLKRGVTGVATQVSGMEAVHDERGKSDLYGRELKMTFRAIADDLAAAAQLLIGESSELIPAVLIRGAPITLTEKMQHDPKMSADECVYMQAFKL
jgi:coenzyme F420-0:L-glutamate ligase